MLNRSAGNRRGTFSASRARIDDVMLGNAALDYDRMLMQLDREPGADGPGPQTNGHKGATLSYRKIQSLEFDPLFLSYMQKPVFREACAKVYGEHASHRVLSSDVYEQAGG